MSLLGRRTSALPRNIRLATNNVAYIFDAGAKGLLSLVTVKCVSTVASSALYSKFVALAPKSNVLFDVQLDNLRCSWRKIEVDGIKLNWDKVGNGPHVVLCLPGLMGSIETDFGKIFKQMNKEKFTLVSWDPPGHGRSRPPDRDHSGIFYQRDAHLVSKLMDKLGYDKFSVLGWSNGGMTGAHITQDYPDKVLKLVIWGSHAYIDERSVLFSRAMSNLKMWSAKMKAPMVQIYGEEYLSKMLIDWADGVQSYYKNGLSKGLLEGMPKMRCPTLVIHGENDPLLGIEHAEFFHKHIQNSTLYVMSNAKHNLHLKFTDEFLCLVEKFLLNNEN